MSRTYRKSKYSDNVEFSWYTNQINSGYAWYGARKLTDEEIDDLKKDLDRQRWKSKTDNRWRYYYSLPKHFRNFVNRNRRTRDKVEVWKAVNWEDYPEQCSKWNCKDNDHWSWY